MSVANPGWGPEPESAASRRMPGGIALSAALHLVLAILVVFGLPGLLREPVEENAPIAVRLVTIGPETRATHPNPENPHRHAAAAKAVPGPPAPKPQPKPPAPTPPPSAAVTPPIPPEPKPAPEAPAKSALAPQPAAPEPKPAPEAPAKAAPPAPKPAPEALAEEVPPLPQYKPRPASAKPLAAVIPPMPKVKPAPPRRLVEEEPRRERIKYSSALFQSLLKNLAPNAAAPDEDAPPQRDRTANGEASSQPKAPPGAQLTVSEIDLIREQIERCWDVPAGARDAKNLVVEIEVSLNPDGTVRQARIVDAARMASDPYFRAAAESARRALFNPLCTPLRLPPDKYPIWKDMVLNFDPRDIL
jgi:outer membrane biosynthesis protein TonB